MQLIDRQCDSCTKPIQFLGEASYCTHCEVPYHTQCLLEGHTCPKCGKDIHCGISEMEEREARTTAAAREVETHRTIGRLLLCLAIPAAMIALYFLIGCPGIYYEDDFVIKAANTPDFFVGPRIRLSEKTPLATTGPVEYAVRRRNNRFLNRPTWQVWKEAGCPPVQWWPAKAYSLNGGVELHNQPFGKDLENSWVIGPAAESIRQEWGVCPDGTLEPTARIRRAKVRTISKDASLQMVNPKTFGPYTIEDATLTWLPVTSAEAQIKDHATSRLTFSLTVSCAKDPNMFYASDLYLSDETDTLYGNLAEMRPSVKLAGVGSRRPLILFSPTLPSKTLQPHKWAVVHLPTGVKWDAPPAPRN